MWWQPSNQMTNEPWISPKAIEILEGLLSNDMTVCEFGGGGSTVWLSERVKNVVTFENNPKWALYIRDLNLQNVTVIPSGQIPDKLTVDLLFLDGEPIELRREWIKASLSIVKKGGIIVLDNANRPEYAKEREWLGQQATLFCSIDANEGGTRHLVTEFYIT